MVVVTRSSHESASHSSESFDGSDKVDKLRKYNVVAPPWCSLAKVPERRKQKKVAPAKWESRSLSPLRVNICQYIDGNKRKMFKRKHNHKACCKKQMRNKNCGKTLIIFIIFLFIGFGITLLWNTQSFSDTKNKISKIVPIKNFMSHFLDKNSVIAETRNLLSKIIPTTNLISLLDLVRTSTRNLLSNVIPKTNFKSLLGLEQTSVREECCSRMKLLTADLLRAEKTLKKSLRLRNTILSSTTKKIDLVTDDVYIEGIIVKRGKDTKEWGSRVALWGIIPLWRAAPPTDTVLSKRKPLPSDCWPFSGSTGELIIELPKRILVRSLSVEHVYPDAALSAPKHFILYSILGNGTWLKTVDSVYNKRGPAKQYFPLQYQDIPHRSFIFKVLSNQGNNQYTCIYRVHLYERHGSAYL